MTTEEPTPRRYGLRGVAINDADGNPICCCECGCEKPRPRHWDRCGNCVSIRGPHREAAAATPSLPLDARRLRYALLDLAGLDYAYEARLDSGDYGLLERPTEFADRITEAYSALSASSEPSKGEVDG